MVPLPEQAIAILKSIPKIGDFIFIIKGDRPISDRTVKALVERMHKQQKSIDGVGYIDINQDNRLIVPHGFRSTFKDWSVENTDYQDVVTELALSHVNSDKARAAYARSQLIDKRCPLMND